MKNALVPETWKHLQLLKYNPVLQQTLSPAHRHIGADHLFSLLSFAIFQAETVRYKQSIVIEEIQEVATKR